MQKDLQRVKAVITYDGSAYFGFQKQKSTKKTITHAIEDALTSIHINEKIVASGRTDAGVHATGQVIHFDLPYYWSDLKKLKKALNRKLIDISFKHISFVPNNFHARFSAKKRLYRYVLKTKTISVFEKKYISYYDEFDSSLLEEALKLFEGEHDFLFFQKTGTETHTTVREIYSTKYKRYNDYHAIYFEANGFLRSQVRLMVHTAMLYAQNRILKEEILEQLKCEKKHNTTLAPQYGLYLAKIKY